MAKIKNIVIGVCIGVTLLFISAPFIFEEAIEVDETMSASTDPALQSKNAGTFPVSALLREKNFMRATSDLNANNDSPVIGSLVEELHILRDTLEAKDLQVEVPKTLATNKSQVDFVLSCDADEEGYVARYFYVFMKNEEYGGGYQSTDKEFSLPKHYINDRDNYIHKIGDRHFGIVLRFYYRSAYEEQSAWGLNFSNLKVSQSEYNMDSPEAFPRENSHSLEEVTIDRKTGESLVETKMQFAGESELVSFSDRYTCKKLTVEAGEVVTDFYTGRALLSALEEWEDLEGEFSESRDTENKL